MAMKRSNGNQPPDARMASRRRSRRALVKLVGALTLARGGWNVAVHHRLSVDEARQTAADCDALSGRAGSAQPVHADLGDEATLRALLPAVVARFGRVDAVVNNA